MQKCTIARSNGDVVIDAPDGHSNIEAWDAFVRSVESKQEAKVKMGVTCLAIDVQKNAGWVEYQLVGCGEGEYEKVELFRVKE
ncbi:hypothetical protein ACFO9Q_14435 [Paenibacillus sp. GCM10023252]|uniref:hypothetical protein n=1 Tax=Paenibacillus sp. GCM10023252 TaxID=3252649 RepID=UPI00360DB0AF